MANEDKPFDLAARNPFKFIYEDFWVPVFGRVLHLFSSWIEGSSPKEKQTYDLRNSRKLDRKN